MVDYEKVEKLVENCKHLYPDIPDYCLWVLACDYYINGEKDEDEDDILAQEGSPARRENTRAWDIEEKKPVKKVTVNNSLEENVSMLSIQQKLKLERQKMLMNALTPMC